MTDTITETPHEKVTRRDLAEGRIEKVMSDRTELVRIAPDVGGIRYDNVMHMAEAARMMATAGPMLPPWLQGNVGGCFGIILRANELRISPMTLAEWSFVTEKGGVQRVGYVSALFHAIVEMRAPIKERLRHEIIGEGDERRCKVWATFRGEMDPRIFISEPLGKLRPEKNERGQIKGSQLWERKPEVQLFYDASRDWARINTPEIIAGMYTKEELIDAGFEEGTGSVNAKDVTPTSSLKLRLGAAKPERAADLREHVNRILRVDEQQSAAGESEASSAAQTAVADELESPAAAEGAVTVSPPTPVTAPTNSAPTDMGGAALSQRADDIEGRGQPHGNAVSAGVSGQAAGAAIIEPTEAELIGAFDRGKADRAAGKKRSAVPTDYRTSNRLALQWAAGWTSGGRL